MITIQIIILSTTFIMWFLRILFRNNKNNKFQYDSWLGGLDTFTKFLYPLTISSVIIIIIKIITYLP